MAGRVPAIHVFLLQAPSFFNAAKTWIPGTRPGMTYLYFGRIASAVPWMKAAIFVTSASVSLPVKSGMP